MSSLINKTLRWCREQARNPRNEADGAKDSPRRAFEKKKQSIFFVLNYFLLYSYIVPM
jgi:hypothetical protein